MVYPWVSIIHPVVYPWVWEVNSLYTRGYGRLTPLYTRGLEVHPVVYPWIRGTPCGIPVVGGIPSLVHPWVGGLHSLVHPGDGREACWVGTLLVYASQYPWWPYYPCIYTLPYPPGYTLGYTRPPTGTRRTTVLSQLAALRHRVVERTVRDGPLTVVPVTDTRFTVG